MSSNNEIMQKNLQDNIRINSGAIIAMGVLLLLTGLFAWGSPLIAGLSVAMLVGIALIIAGIAQLVFAFKSGIAILNLILGVLTVVLGAYMANQPDVALGSLTAFLMFYLILSGIIEVMWSIFRIGVLPGWGWSLVGGIISILLGIMIWQQFPLSGAWAIGILVGVRLFFNGLTLLMLGLAARR